MKDGVNNKLDNIAKFLEVVMSSMHANNETYEEELIKKLKD